MSLRQEVSRPSERAATSWPTAASTVTLLVVVLLIGALWSIQTDLLNEIVVWIQRTQRDLHSQLTHALRLVANGEVNAFWTLIGVSLFYGVFHAVGPGHGKAVIATYLGSNPVLLRRGIVLSLLGSLLQGVTAIMIVEVGSRVLGMSMRRVHGLGLSLENISFAFVSLLGTVILLRGLLLLYRHARGVPPIAAAHERENIAAPSKDSLFTSGGKMQAYCETCGVAHGPARHHIEHPLAFRSAALAVLSIGLRPCTGALLILIVAYSLNLRWAGTGAILAMSLGTATAVAMLAAATIYARNGLLGLLGGIAGRSRQVSLLFAVAGTAGGLLLLILGISLLSQGLQAEVHPFLRVL